MGAPLECMFDTNIFDHILDGAISLESLRGSILPYATHIQRDEINDIPEAKTERREKLAALFVELVTELPTDSFSLGTSRIEKARLGGNRVVPTESAVWNVSKWGEAKWTAADNLCTPIKAALDRIKLKPNNIKDALIAETAIKRGYVLVTEDEDLLKVAKSFRARCLSLSELIAVVRS